MGSGASGGGALGPWHSGGGGKAAGRVLELQHGTGWGFGVHLLVSPCVSSPPLHSHSRSRRAWALERLGSLSRRKMNFTALWAWRGSRRSCRRLGPEEERSPAAAMERKTLNVRGRWGGEARALRVACPAGKGPRVWWEGLRTAMARKEAVPASSRVLPPRRPPPVVPPHPSPAVHPPASGHPPPQDTPGPGTEASQAPWSFPDWGDPHH